MALFATGYTMLPASALKTRVSLRVVMRRSLPATVRAHVQPRDELTEQQHQVTERRTYHHAVIARSGVGSVRASLSANAKQVPTAAIGIVIKLAKPYM